MCGQLHVASVRVESLPDVWKSFTRGGFTVVPGDSCGSGCDQAVRIRREDRELTLGVDNHGRDPSESLIVIGYPPYSASP